VTKGEERRQVTRGWRRLWGGSGCLGSLGGAPVPKAAPGAKAARAGSGSVGPTPRLRLAQGGPGDGSPLVPGAGGVAGGAAAARPITCVPGRGRGRARGRGVRGGPGRWRRRGGRRHSRSRGPRGRHHGQGTLYRQQRRGEAAVILVNIVMAGVGRGGLRGGGEGGKRGRDGIGCGGDGRGGRGAGEGFWGERRGGGLGSRRRTRSGDEGRDSPAEDDPRQSDPERPSATTAVFHPFVGPRPAPPAGRRARGTDKRPGPGTGSGGAQTRCCDEKTRQEGEKDQERGRSTRGPLNFGRCRPTAHVKQSGMLRPAASPPGGSPRVAPRAAWSGLPTVAPPSGAGPHGLASAPGRVPLPPPPRRPGHAGRSGNDPGPLVVRRAASWVFLCIARRSSASGCWRAPRARSSWRCPLRPAASPLPKSALVPSGSQE